MATHCVAVTSYETLRKYSKDLAGTFDLMVCDEGHRLKSVGGNKTQQALEELNTRRRILLTGVLSCIM
jgi:DNA repair and recombination protein RAD54B